MEGTLVEKVFSDEVDSEEIADVVAFLLMKRELEKGIIMNSKGYFVGSRCGNRWRNRGYGLEEMEHLSDKYFSRMFRVSRNSFNHLEYLMKRVFEEDFVLSNRRRRSAVNSSGSIICLRTRLACAMRYLAGASYLDICFEFGVGTGSFYADDGVLWGTLEKLDLLLTIGFPFDDEDKLRQMAEGFSSFSHGALKDCVLAVDGWVCHTRKPTYAETQHPLAYRNRKDCFGLVVIAGCDSACRFHMFSCKSSGSTNDIVAWDISEMKVILESGALPPRYYFVGDEAFQNVNYFLTPWSGHGLDAWKDSFNYHLSAMRQCIERAFAFLTQRWGIFWRPLRCDFKRWTLICSVCAKLHNFCIDMQESLSDIPERLLDDYVEDDHHYVLDNANGGPERPGRPIGDRRKIETELLKERGIRRKRHINNLF